MIIRRLFALPHTQLSLFLTPNTWPRGLSFWVWHPKVMWRWLFSQKGHRRGRYGFNPSCTLWRHLNSLLFKWTTLKRVAIDMLNLSVAGLLLSFSQKRARKSPDREIWRIFLWISYIFLCSETPGILFFNLALVMGYQSRVLTTHDLDLIICWKQKSINQPLILKNELWLQPAEQAQPGMLTL